MDYTLPPEYRMLQRTIREFVDAEIAPIAAQIDREDCTPPSLVRKMAQAGMFGLPFSTKYGGSGAGELGYCIMMEEIARASSAVGVIVGAHIGIGGGAIYIDGSEEQKQRYMPTLCRGEKLAAFCLTEPQAGSDAANLRTTATRDGDYWVLNGTKLWASNGNRADILSVFAANDRSMGARGGITAFIVEKEFGGVTVARLEEKMGLHGSDTALLIFENCRVPRENVIGMVGAGFLTAMKTLDGGRLSLGAAALGGAQYGLETMVRWAQAAVENGQPLANRQAIQWMIADTAMEVAALRHMVYSAAWLFDQGKKVSRESAMIKAYATEVGARTVDRAIQVHGRAGLRHGAPVERHFRDERIARIFEGTNEVQRMIIAQETYRQMGYRA
ncbi:MAG TPA: acyl-CoA dehydrogenase family protein [Chloroflexia bacterium]|nr:acyl-CoA dehydrogenase family protein [Chloroflexia bacterium]